MSSHVVRSENCTPASCPDYATHARLRYQWGQIKNLYSPNTKNAVAERASRDMHLGDAIARSQEYTEFQQPKEKAA